MLIHKWDNYINHYHYPDQDSGNSVEEGAESIYIYKKNKTADGVEYRRSCLLDRL